jgi:alanine-glyoxylate transaminase / serine-glyoxylate transaminase / serine-pyruvate transaminase
MASVAYKRLNPVERTILTPELSNASPRARQGLIGTLQGATDPVFLAVIEQARALLRHLWDTDNADTFIVPGTEEAGMEAVLVNLVKPGDRVLVGVNGTAGERISATAERVGANVQRLEAPWGAPILPDQLERAIADSDPEIVAVAHGEASTGVLQPLASLAEVAHEHDALLVADVCSTTAVVDVAVDTWGIDACWAGSQKGLSAYPGLALLTFGPRAVARHADRRTAVASWYFDLDGLRRFGQADGHQQTYPAPLLYALTEVLQLAYEQGMEYRVARHHNRRDALVAGLEALGLDVLAPEDPDLRLPSVTVVRVPAGIDEGALRTELRQQFRIEIAGGAGPWAGQVWRIGLMSHSAQPGFIVQLLTLLETLLVSEGYAPRSPGAAARIAAATLEH